MPLGLLPDLHLLLAAHRRNGRSRRTSSPPRSAGQHIGCYSRWLPACRAGILRPAWHTADMCTLQRGLWLLHFVAARHLAVIAISLA